MEASSRSGAVAGIFVLTFLLNLFFGYFRAKSGKYSLKWFIYIHLPIPVVVLARLYYNVDYNYIPVFLIAAVAGQVAGGKVEI